MRTGTIVGTLLLLALSTSAFAATITIDSFDSPDPSAVFFTPGEAPWGNGNPTILEHADAGILGGERDVKIEVAGTPKPISAAGIIGGEDGLFQLATFGRPGSFVTLQYDGVDADGGSLVDSEGLGGIDLTDGGMNNALRLSFVSIDGGDATALGVKVSVVSSSGTSTFSGIAPEAMIPYNFDIDFSDFSDPSALAGVKSITINLNNSGATVPNVDFQLDSIAAVPEPSTFAMLAGLGALLLLSVARRRKS